MSESSGGVFGRFRRGLAKTRAVLGRPVVDILAGTDRDASLRELEIALVKADVGVDLAREITAALRARPEARKDPVGALRDELVRAVTVEPVGRAGAHPEPEVVFFVGVNGTGKTTTMGKYAAALRAAGRKPLLAACDTFRAAAVDQLARWSEMAEVPIVRQSSGADPAAVLHDAISRAKERGESPVLVDTAGRLHVKTHLMSELAKMGRVAARLVEGAPHETWLVVDATTGQNGLVQAREFGKAIPLTGVVLTKLDGTAKGGVVLAIAREFQVPVRHVGVGESVEDLLPFEPAAYVDGLLELPAPADA